MRKYSVEPPFRRVGLLVIPVGYLLYRQGLAVPTTSAPVRHAPVTTSLTACRMRWRTGLYQFRTSPLHD